MIAVTMGGMEPTMDDSDKPDFYEHLCDQLDLLEMGIRNFDQHGDVHASTLAVALRVLFHNGRGGSTSLLRLLESENWALQSSCGDGQTKKEVEQARASGRFTFIIDMEFTVAGARPYLAQPRGLVPLATWWDDEIVYSDGRVFMTRKDVVLALANKDGGAHVDARIPPNLQALKAGVGTFEFRREDGSLVTVELKNHHRRVVRLIAEEVLLSMDLRPPKQ